MGATNQLTVLLVEDNPADQTVVARVLSRARRPIDITTARRLADAEVLLSSRSFDAVILDLSLPDSDSHNTLSAVRRIAPDVPIVVLTGSEDESYALAAVEQGAQDYLSKAHVMVEPMLERSLRYAVARHQSESDLRNTREQLLKSQKMESIGRLAGGVAHDLNNILTAIFSFGDFVLSELKPDEPAHDDMQEVLSAARRAEKLTSQLLAFSRRKTVAPRVMSVNEAVADVERMLDRILGEDVELIAHLGEDVGRVFMDSAAFEQVLVNLAVNARDAMPSGGRLTVETGAGVLTEAGALERDGEAGPGEYVWVAVSDTGVGMDEATRDRMFEPFFTTKPTGKGTGLGLATCYGIIKQAGGFITVYSEVGRGTTFKIQIPRSRDAPHALVPPVATVHAGGDESILIAEDDPQVRQLTVRTLRRLGYRVEEVDSGERALELCATLTEPFDLLLTDVIMRGMNGKRLAQRLGHRFPTMKVLFMSGYTADAIVHHGVLDTGVVLLQKPFTPEALAAQVREVLDSPERTAAALSVPRILAAVGDAALLADLTGRAATWEVVGARDGHEALALLARQDFDGVIADPTLPGLPADELLDHLRARNPLLVGRVVLIDSVTPTAEALIRALEKLLG